MKGSHHRFTGVLLVLMLGAGVGAPPAGAATAAESWRPNFRIGQVVFNRDLPDTVEVLRRGRAGYFAVRPEGGGPVIRGYVFDDPNAGIPGARAIWTTSREVRYRRVGVGNTWRYAKRRLGRRWSVAFDRRCGWLQSSRLRDDDVGPVSTQLYFSRRTGRIFRIALNEITELGCP
ncbi:MAG: hypothetical protein WD844_04770 [Thermoleophilaceae bacterium]